VTYADLTSTGQARNVAGAMRQSPRAQATVETAMMIPVVVVLLAALVQVVVVVRDQVHVVRVTSAVARAVMVEPDEQTARRTVDSLRGDLEVERVEMHGGREPGDILSVSVVARPRRLPLVGLAVAPLRLTERVTVRVEG